MRFGSLGMAQILLDQLNLHAPTAFIRSEGFCAALERDAIEAGFADRQPDAIRRVS